MRQSGGCAFNIMLQFALKKCERVEPHVMFLKQSQERISSDIIERCFYNQP